MLDRMIAGMNNQGGILLKVGEGKKGGKVLKEKKNRNRRQIRGGKL